MLFYYQNDKILESLDIKICILNKNLQKYLIIVEDFMARYLITFDIDTKLLEKHYHNSNWTNAYTNIRQVLKNYGFTNIQGSVYEGDEGVSEAHGTIAIQELTWRFYWFNVCVSNIRFLRIESDLNAQFISDQMQLAIDNANEHKKQLINKYKRMNLTDEQIDELIKDNNITLPTLDDLHKKPFK